MREGGQFQHAEEKILSTLRLTLKDLAERTAPLQTEQPLETVSWSCVIIVFFLTVIPASVLTSMTLAPTDFIPSNSPLAQQ